MTPKEIGEQPAFPTYPRESFTVAHGGIAKSNVHFDGMSTRLFLAGIAMQGLCASAPLMQFIADTGAEIDRPGFALMTIPKMSLSMADALLAEIALEPVRSASRPRIVCICGSSRFCDIAAVEAWNFEKQGIMAVGMHLLPQWYWEATGKVGHGHGAEQEGVAHILDELHLRKIDLSDEVFVVNRGGYIGDRTRIEINYALSHGKPVRYMEQNK